MKCDACSTSENSDEVRSSYFEGKNAIKKAVHMRTISRTFRKARGGCYRRFSAKRQFSDLVLSFRDVLCHGVAGKSALAEGTKPSEVSA
jgi:predicted ATPase